MPDRRSIFRLLALAGFLLTVALALWLAEVRPLLVIIVMALALGVAWSVEWLSWRQEVPREVVVEGAAATEAEEGITVLPPVEEPVAAEAPPVPLEAWRPSPSSSPSLGARRRGPAAARHRRADRLRASSRRLRPPSSPRPPSLSPPSAARARAAPPPPRPPLRPVPPPPPEPAPPPPLQPAAEPVRPAASSDVVDLRLRATIQPRRWNLWDLERRARDELPRDPIRYEEWSYLFVHLRQFATPDGSLPTEFDGLVRESFGELLERAG